MSLCIWNGGSEIISPEVSKLITDGQIAEMRSEYENAAICFRKVLEIITPSSRLFLQMRCNLGCTLASDALKRELPFPEEAVQLWQSGVDVGHPYSMYYLARYLDRIGKKEESEKLYIHAAEEGNDAARSVLCDKGIQFNEY